MVEWFDLIGHIADQKRKNCIFTIKAFKTHIPTKIGCKFEMPSWKGFNQPITTITPTMTDISHTLVQYKKLYNLITTKSASIIKQP